VNRRRGLARAVSWFGLVLSSGSPLAAQELGPAAAEWRALASGVVAVRYAEGDSLLARRVLDQLLAQPPLPALPPDVPRGATAWLAPDEAAFVALAGQLPDWSGGFAIPSRRLLVIPVYASGRSSVGGRGAVLRHEWAHLGLHDHLEGLRVPRWFDEGYARWAEGGFDASEAWRLRLLLALGRAPPLDSLSLAWPADRASAEAAYLLSASAVAYLLEESGEPGIRALLERWRATGSFEGALRATYGVTSGQLEEDWRRWVRRRYGWVLALTNSVLVWMLLGALVGALALIRRRRDRERMARLRAGEPEDRPAWWTEAGEAGGERPV
jgi:hypothetical protein